MFIFLLEYATLNVVKDMKKQKTKRNISSLSRMDDSLKKVIIIIVCVVVFFGFMYFLTTRIIEKNETTSKKQANETTTIQYDKILAGEVFNQAQEEYLVVFYDENSTDTTFKSMISTYQSKTDVTRLYSVDLNHGMNKKYKTDEDINTSSPSELKVKTNTLLRFKEGKVTEVITDSDKISEYLSS